MGTWLGRILWICACGCALAMAGLLGFERSGLLVHVLRERIARDFPALGARLTIERAELRWFEPGLVLEGVHLVGGRGGAADLLALESLHLRLSPDLQSLRSLDVRGGRVLVRDQLFEEIRRQVEESSRTGRVPLANLPSCSLSDFEVTFELPDGTPFELGTVDLLARPRPEGGFELAGRFSPTLAGAVAEPATILVSGRVAKEGAALRASARDVPLQTKGFRVPAFLGSLPVSECSARLTLDSNLEIPFTEPLLPRSKLRASLREGRLLPAAGGPWWEGLEIDVQSSFHPGPGLALWHRDSWTAYAALGAISNATPFRAWAEFGGVVRDGAWVRAWASAQGLSVDEAALTALGIEDRFRFLRDILTPSGRVDATCTVLAGLDPERGWRRELALHVHSSGGLALAYQGLPAHPGSGFPLPVAGVRGDLVFTESSTGTRRWRMAAVDLAADHGSGSCSGWSQLTPSPVPDARPSFDLVLRTPSLAVDERLRLALEESRHLSWVWPAFSPGGGAVSANWRMRDGNDTGGLSAAGAFGLHGVGLRWRELPVLLEGVDGELSVLWAERPSVVLGAGALPARPVGVAYELRNEHEPRSRAQARIRGFVRQESLPREVAPGAIPSAKVQETAVEIDDLLLRGADFDVLAARFPVLGRQVSELGARGRMRVSYRGARAHPALPFASSVEAVPREVEITPRFFQRRIRDLQGRILVQSSEAQGGAGDLSQLNLAGNWAGGEELAARGSIPGTGDARVQVFGAGVDPTNTSFKGALVTTLSEGSSAAGGLDLSGWTLAGPVDFAVESTFDPDSGPARSRYRAYLRDNDLETKDLRLEGMHGAFEQSGEVLESPLVFAALGGHPIELHDVRMFPLEAAGRVSQADPWLAREGFWKDPKGRALQADLFVKDLPLDEEHLRDLLSEPALDVLRENEAWRGKIDVLGARILVTSEADGAGKVAVRGPVRPHDLAMRLGLPIAVESADVKLEELVLESGRYRGWARIEGLEARIAERALSGASMIAGYVDGRLTVDDLSGNFEGGRLESLGGSSKALGIDLADPHRFDVAIRLEDVHVDGLLRGVFQSSIAEQGLLDATLQLSGTPQEILGLTGRGSLSLDEGSLWSIPVMRELFRQLGFDRTGVFDRLRSRFELRDGRIRLSHLELKSDLFDLVGRGWQDLDGRLSFDLEVRYGLLDRLGVLNRFLYWLNNNLWRVAVRGDFGRPRVVIRNSLIEMLQRFDEQPHRTLPLPKFSSLGPRF